MIAQQLPQPDGISEMVSGLIFLNYEYRSVICIGDECKKAVGVGWHLRKVRNVDRSISYTVNRLVRGPEWIHQQRSPEDVLAPQAGMAVVDGFQCRHCHEFRSRSEAEVDKQWCRMKHGVGLGGMTERVKLQSWRQGRKYGRYWAVKERGNVGKETGFGNETGEFEN